MNKKEENARVLDPMRFRITKNMPYVQGGPDNNNPMNVTDNASPQIQAPSIYGDFQQNYQHTMGTGAVNPVNIAYSGLNQSNTIGQKNNGIPYGMQQQPDTAGVSPATDGMEAGRQAQAAQQRGLFAGPMGMMGQPVVQGNMPENPAFSGPPMMQGMPSAEQAAGKGMNTRTGKRGK